MHARKASRELWKLAAAAPTIETFTRAATLLDQLDRDNRDVDDDERSNGIVRSKIRSARGWFEILCGVGEDGEWDENRLRDFLRQDLAVIEDNIQDDGLCSSFRRWPGAELPAAKCRYGLAYYNREGTIEAHPEYMSDMQGVGPQSIAHFLERAGNQGWELCSLLPSSGKGDDFLIFKRPAS